MTHNILVVEDDSDIQELLVSYLIADGFDVQTARDGLSAIQMFNSSSPSLVILDRMLPGISGDQVCEEIRRISDVPILMLTAKSTESSKIEGFELGVDDYVTKPFSAKEVVFRVKALIKRSYSSKADNIYQDDELFVDLDKRAVSINDDEIHLTANEFDILEALLRNRPNPLTRSQIVENAFGLGYEAYERNLDTYIKNIRHKIEADQKNPKYIVTKYGVGYYFNG